MYQRNTDGVGIKAYVMTVPIQVNVSDLLSFHNYCQLYLEPDMVTHMGGLCETITNASLLGSCGVVFSKLYYHRQMSYRLNIYTYDAKPYD